MVLIRFGLSQILEMEASLYKADRFCCETCPPIAGRQVLWRIGHSGAWEGGKRGLVSEGCAE